MGFVARFCRFESKKDSQKQKKNHVARQIWRWNSFKQYQVYNKIGNFVFVYPKKKKQTKDNRKCINYQCFIVASRHRALKINYCFLSLNWRVSFIQERDCESPLFEITDFSVPNKYLSFHTSKNEMPRAGAVSNSESKRFLKYISYSTLILRVKLTHLIQ